MLSKTELHRKLSIDLFTDMAAILNKLDLKSYGMPRGHEHILFTIYKYLSGQFFLSFLRIGL